MNDNKAYIAHKRASDGIEQIVAAHLKEAREGSQKCAAKMDCGEAGGLIGLLHDFGKSTSPNICHNLPDFPTCY
jgi:CRISPR-associated endonuclease/helicase Cas3